MQRMILPPLDSFSTLHHQSQQRSVKKKNNNEYKKKNSRVGTGERAEGGGKKP